MRRHRGRRPQGLSTRPTNPPGSIQTRLSCGRPETLATWAGTGGRCTLEGKRVRAWGSVRAGPHPQHGWPVAAPPRTLTEKPQKWGLYSGAGRRAKITVRAGGLAEKHAEPSAGGSGPWERARGPRHGRKWEPKCATLLNKFHQAIHRKRAEFCIFKVNEKSKQLVVGSGTQQELKCLRALVGQTGGSGHRLTVNLGRKPCR